MAATVQLRAVFAVAAGRDDVVIDNGVGEGGGGRGGGGAVTVGVVIVNVTEFEVPPLRPDVKTVTLAVPVFVMRVPAMVALS